MGIQSAPDGNESQSPLGDKVTVSNNKGKIPASKRTFWTHWVWI